MRVVAILRPRIILLAAMIAATGCAFKGPSATSTTFVAPAFKHGMVHGGQQPISGATVQLYAVGASGDGSAASPLLTTAVTTDSNGNFNITGDFACPTSQTLVYLVASGGNPGLSNGVNNSQLALMAALGQCSSLTPTTYILIDELTTVAAVSSLAPFMSSSSAIGSSLSDGSALASAFATAAELVNTATGTAPGVGVPAGATVPTALIDSLGDAVASCVNSAGGVAGDGSACGTLLALATPAGEVAPTDTIAALLQIVNNPSSNATLIVDLGTPTGPFQPILSAPTDNLAVVLGTSFAVTPSSLTFSPTPSGSTSNMLAITLTNSGSQAVAYSSAGVTGGNSTDFSLTGNCAASIAAGASCVMQVAFTPIAVGERSSNLVLVNGSSDPVLTVALNGNGLATEGALSSNPGKYVLVWQDNFATDPSNAGGELQNIAGSSSAPKRPDWMYRTGYKYETTQGTTAANVQLTNSGPLPGLSLIDIASNPNTSGLYQTYTVGGIISTRWLQYGYYETQALVGVPTNNVGFHTSFWNFGQGSTYSPYALDEVDGFESDSFNVNDVNGGSGITYGFTSGLIYHNIQGSGDGDFPAAHIRQDVSLAAVHTFGFSWTPTGLSFYEDGAQLPTPAGALSTYGAFSPQNVWLTSIGSPKTGAGCSWVGPCLTTSDSSTYAYNFSYFDYYQPTIAMQDILPIPSTAILIDPTAPSSGTTSFTTSGSWSVYVAGLPYQGAANANMLVGPEGYRGQYAMTSTTPGNTATWSHQFTSADAGSYDVYVWNATVHQYQLPGSTVITAPDSASNTQVALLGSTGTQPPSLNINQGTAGQEWVPLNSISGQQNPTNTYAFASGATGQVAMTVETESSTASDASSFVPHTNADSVVFLPVHTVGVSAPFNTGDSYVDTNFSTSTLTGWAGTPSRYALATAGTATWTATLAQPGTYALSVWVPVNSSNTTVAYYTVSDGTSQTVFGPIKELTYSAQWVPLGNFTFASTTATVVASNGNGGSVSGNGILRTNALKLVPQVPSTYEVCTTSPGLYGVGLFSYGTGTWTAGTGGANECGGVDEVTTSASAAAYFTLQVPVQGMYHAYIYNDASLSPTATVAVTSHSSVQAVCSGLTKTGPNQWIYLGDYFFAPGTITKSSSLAVDKISVTSGSGSTAVSAVKLVYSGELGVKANECTNN